jgi:hypothetical protein
VVQFGVVWGRGVGCSPLWVWGGSYVGCGPTWVLVRVWSGVLHGCGVGCGVWSCLGVGFGPVWVWGDV